MTAPGNSTVLVVLLAAFIACSAYAAGRLHQRIRTGRDRDEAYRDGYDTATRNVFSLAARLIGPRRSTAIRGSAKVPAVSAAASSGRRRSGLASYRDNARTLPRTSKPPVPSDSIVDTTLLPDVRSAFDETGAAVFDMLPAFDATGAAVLDARDESPTRPVASPVSSGRHTAPDEAATRRLTPDRLARASSLDAGPSDDATTRLPPVPRPRSS